MSRQNPVMKQSELTATEKSGLYGIKLFLRKIFGLMSLQHRTKVLRKFYIEITFYISLLLPCLYNFKINIFDFILFNSRQYFYLFISHSSQIVKWRRLYSFRHFSLTINKLKIWLNSFFQKIVYFFISKFRICTTVARYQSSHSACKIQCRFRIFIG